MQKISFKRYANGYYASLADNSDPFESFEIDDFVLRATRADYVTEAIDDLCELNSEEDCDGEQVFEIEVTVTMKPVGQLIKEGVTFLPISDSNKAEPRKRLKAKKATT